MVTYSQISEFGLGRKLIITDIVNFVQLEQEANFFAYDRMQNIDVDLVNGNDAVVKLVVLYIKDKAVEPIGECADCFVVTIIDQLGH